jgi:phenol hydroxylase P1 protein
MLVDFIFSWQEDTTKWLDSIIKVMADESEDNKEQLSKWSKEYIDKTKVALTPLSKFSTNKELLGEIEQNLIDRLNKSGLKIFGLEV